VRRAAGAAPEWPKRLPELTEEQERIREDFYELWLETLPRKYKLLERFDHTYPAHRAKPGERTLDVGAGTGTQLEWEDLENQDYVAVDLRENHLAQLRERSTCSSTSPTCPRRWSRSTGY
jgi:SAM-dependent methyltransferase